MVILIDSIVNVNNSYYFCYLIFLFIYIHIMSVLDDRFDLIRKITITIMDYIDSLI